MVTKYQVSTLSKVRLKLPGVSVKQQLNNNMDKSANSKFSSFYCSVFMIPVRALYWPIIDPRELLGTWVRIGVFPVSQYMRTKRGEGVKGQLILE